MGIDGDDHLVHRQLQLARGGLHDADVGLVRDQPVELFDAAAGLREHGAGGAFEHAHRQLEHRLAIHLEQGVAQHLAARHRARHAQDVDVAPVGMQVGGQDAGRVAGAQQHRTGAVAEEHAGAAVVEVEDAREHFRADHQRRAGRADADHGIGHGQRIDEAGAHRLHVEGRAAVHAELALHDGGGGREHHVRRRGGDDDQVDVLGAGIRPPRAHAARHAPPGRWH